MHDVVEVQLDGRAMVVSRPAAASKLQDSLIRQAQRLHDVIEDALDSGERIPPVQASLMLARAVEAARKLAPLVPPEQDGASVEDLASRAEQLRDATQELLRRTQSIDVTPK